MTAGPPGGAVLLDLDETLIVEERAVVAAFRVTAVLAAASVADVVEVDVDGFAADARAHARRLFWADPAGGYARSIGISSWEALWCRFIAFGGEPAAHAALRAANPSFRRAVWAAALAARGVGRSDADDLGAVLADTFADARRAGCGERFADAMPALVRLRAGGHPLAIVSNGASCLQREKLAAAGLAGSVDAVVISGDVGARKPEPAPFVRALALLGADPGRATMIGDRLDTDIAGARAAGIAAIHLDRSGAGPAGADAGDGDAGSVTVIRSLDELGV